ncbi:MAG: hypothetical protein K0S09_1918 [Sphingobacteriaceae bacterium]|jgi:hypothetical protein|nr:hypothetical protein [Sphingobacteriaceae bacterium]
MVEATQELDLERIAKYNEVLNAQFRLIKKSGWSQVIPVELQLEITDEQFDPFRTAFCDLATSFNIPEEHHKYLLFICQNFYNKVQDIDAISFELQEAYDTILFFKGYAEMVDKEQKKLKGKGVPSKPAFTLQVQKQGHSKGIEMSLTLSTIALKSIYTQQRIRLSRSNYSGVLRSYKVIPPLDVLTSLTSDLESEINYPGEIFVSETVDDLKDYISTYLPHALVNQKNEFIFDLLYLFDILRFTGKVDNFLGTDLIRKDFRIANYRTLPANFNKARYITALQKKRKLAYKRSLG